MFSAQYGYCAGGNSALKSLEATAPQAIRELVIPMSEQARPADTEKSVSNRTASEYNALKLDKLQRARIGTLWACGKGVNPEAVVMFKILDAVSGSISGTTPLAIQDQQICDALHVSCPFVANAYALHNNMFGNPVFQYYATNGEYEDTVAFISDGKGMKLVKIANGSQPFPVGADNWYFNPGECVKF
jgi:hypothetical protein